MGSLVAVTALDNKPQSAVDPGILRLLFSF